LRADIYALLWCADSRRQFRQAWILNSSGIAGNGAEYFEKLLNGEAWIEESHDVAGKSMFAQRLAGSLECLE